MPSNKDAQYWQNYFKAWNNFYSAKRDLVMKTESLVEIVRQGIIHPNQRHAALEIAHYLKVEQLQELFSTLLETASYQSAVSPIANEIILKLPHDWLLENIEAHAEKILSAEDDFDYRGLFVLYRQIDVVLAKRLIARALASSNPEVREVGADFAEVLAGD